SLGKGLAFLPAQPAIRYRYLGNEARGRRPGYGENPPEGAFIHYQLPKKPKGDVTLEILDSKGQLVDTLTSKKEEEPEAPVKRLPLVEEEASDKPPEKLRLPNAPGLHRIAWNLSYAGARAIDDAKIDNGQPRSGPLVNPGLYTLKLTVEGQTLTRPLLVKL